MPADRHRAGRSGLRDELGEAAVARSAKRCAGAWRNAAVDDRLSGLCVDDDDLVLLGDCCRRPLKRCERDLEVHYRRSRIAGAGQWRRVRDDQSCVSGEMYGFAWKTCPARSANVGAKNGFALSSFERSPKLARIPFTKRAFSGPARSMKQASP